MTNSINESNIVLVTDVSPLKCRTRFIKKKNQPYLLWSYNLQLQSLHPNELSRVITIH